MMTTRTATLTNEQLAILPKFRAEWLQWGICTERADRQKAETSILAMRQRIGVLEKPIFIWCASPATSLIATHFLKSSELKKSGASLRASLGASLKDSLVASLGASLEASLKDSLGASLRASLGASLRASLGASLRDSLVASLGASLGASLKDSLGASLWASLGASLRALLGASLVASLGASLGASLKDSLGASLRASLGGEWWGQHDSYWIAFYLFCRDVIGVKYDNQKSKDLDLWRDIAQSCCWWWCFQNYVIISERPTVCKLDDREVLHCESGPALAFADGLTLHAWHGQRIPAEWIEDKKSLTPQFALQQKNVELRRAACEIIGWAHILRELKAKTIHKDDDPMIGELLEGELPDSGKQQFLRVLCGTGRTFAIPVPSTVHTALEANAWTYGLSASNFKPEGRA